MAELNGRVCPVCDGLLGELAHRAAVHNFCAWATPADWRAIRPWLLPKLPGVTMAGT